MPPVIRSASANDVPALLAIEQGAPSAAHWNREQYTRAVTDGIVLVAEEAGTLCGFMCAKAIVGEWEIENLVVAGAFLRRGIATQLLRALIHRAESAAVSAILLEVRESNLPARRLYEKLGFSQEGLRRAYYRGPVEAAVLYGLRLLR
jgi:ribosomal-protein-alanine N-acetyltransferase